MVLLCVQVPITVIKPQDLLTAPDIDPVEPAAAAAVVVQTPSSYGGSQAAAAAGSSNLAGADAVGVAGAAAVGNGGSGGEGGVLPPHTLHLGPVKLSPGQEVRHFVGVPAGATWAELLVRAGGYDTPRVFLIRWVWLCVGGGAHNYQ